jgi:microcystin degradation protein MlrC
MRIAVAGFMHESNTFNPLRTDRAAFAAQALTEGTALLEEWHAAHHEMAGFLQTLERDGVETVPLLMAWATPAGPVAAEAFEEISGRLGALLSEARTDGLLLALHGAMVAEGHDDADGEIVSRLRKVVGPDFPIFVTLDLHGNVSERLVEQSTFVTAYRTCPHIDQFDTGQLAASRLVQYLRGQINKPSLALAKPPLIVNIMKHDTSREPLRSFMAEAQKLEEDPDILAASLLPGFAYADVPQMGPSVLVATNGDAGRARGEANRIAQQLWDARATLDARLPDAAQAVAQALQAERRPVVLVETGDNVGGGSAGDGTHILTELLRQGATGSVVCLYAPEEAAQCARAGVNATTTLTVGGKLDRLHGDPVTVTGQVRVLHDGTYVEPAVRHGGKRINHMGLTALVELPGGNLLVLNTLRHPPFSLGQLTCLGIDPQQMNILVVKAAIAYKAAYSPVAGTIIDVDTPGLTAVNPHRFAYRKIRRPLYPLDG